MNVSQAAAYVKRGKPFGNYHWEANYLAHLREIEGFRFGITQSDPVSGLAPGATVTLKDWCNGEDYVKVEVQGKPATVLKLSLRTLPQTATMLRQYRIRELEASRRMAIKRMAVRNKLQDALIEASTNVGNYKSKPEIGHRNVATATNNLLAGHGNYMATVRSLGLYLLYEVRYNQFDRQIERCTKFYNDFYKSRGEPLDPNVVKSIMYEESKCGLNGPFMHEPPADPNDTFIHHPFMQQTNLLQAIDSYADQMLGMVKRMASATPEQWPGAPKTVPNYWGIFELVKLEENIKKSKPLANFPLEMSRRWTWSKSPGGPGALGNAAVALCLWKEPGTGINAMGNRVSPIWNDYEFWIRTAVCWLWVKYHGLADGKRNWLNAVAAYNGSTKYAEAVFARLSGKGDLMLSAAETRGKR